MWTILVPLKRHGSWRCITTLPPKNGLETLSSPTNPTLNRTQLEGHANAIQAPSHEPLATTAARITGVAGRGRNAWLDHVDLVVMSGDCKRSDCIICISSSWNIYLMIYAIICNASNIDEPNSFINPHPALHIRLLALDVLALGDGFRGVEANSI